MTAPPSAAGPRRNARYTVLPVDGPLPADMVRAVPRILSDPLGFLAATVARYGDLVAFPLPRTPALLVNDPAGARRVLQDNHRGYGKRTVQYGALAAVTGEGLLTSDGEIWLRHRRIMQPAFHHDRAAAVGLEAVAAAERLLQRWEAAGPGAVVDAEAGILAAMLEVVGHTLFDADLAAVGERVVHAVEVALRHVMRQARSPLPAGLPTPGRLRLRRAVGRLDALVAAVVDERRRRGVRGDDPDLLALLLRAGLGPAEVRDEVVTLVIAGHETVASALSWTLALLAADPVAQARVHDELDAVLAGRSPVVADLPRLVRTRAAVDEALRLYPPAWVLTRRALADDVVAGVAVPAGTLVLISPWLLHRRAQSWPEPARFEPARFEPARFEPARFEPARFEPAHPEPGSYLPFGAGPRLCIGRDFALVEAVLVLAGLLRERRVERPPGAELPRAKALVTLRPRGGLPVVLVRR